MNRPVQSSSFLRALAGIIGVAALLVSGSALASTAANTVISNTAVVNYNDAGGNAQAPVSASATVTVTLVPSAVTLSSPANQTIAQGTSATLSYTITSTANGPDTYNLGSAAVASSVSGVTPTFPASVALGGTTLAVAANVNDATITVPYDGVVSATVNGITAGSVIVVGGSTYTVSSVTKNAVANTATIGLGAGRIPTAVAVGSIVGEQKTFTVSVPSGNVSVGYNSGTQTVTTTATAQTAPGPATSQATPTVITVQRPTLTVQKLVSLDGTTFAANVSAAPGTPLYYKIIATNGGASAATQVAFTDAIPVYLTYTNGSGKYATSAATTYAAASGLTEGSGGYTYAAGTVSYNPGGGTGTVPGGGSVLVLFFKATIN
jgi:hypothetical protein